MRLRGAVLSEESVASPVVAVLHSSPMHEDEFHPLGVCSLLSPQAADVEATLLGRGAALLDDLPGPSSLAVECIGGDELSIECRDGLDHLLGGGLFAPSWTFLVVVERHGLRVPIGMSGHADHPEVVPEHLTVQYQ